MNYLKRIQLVVSHVFISYSRNDIAQVDPLVEVLVGSGYDVWIDRRNVKGGIPWDNQVAEGISASETFLLVLSQVSVKSENVLKELRYASNKGKSIFPIMLGQVELPPVFEFQLGNDHRVDLSQEGADKVIADLGGKRYSGPAKEVGPYSLGNPQQDPKESSSVINNQLIANKRQTKQRKLASRFAFVATVSIAITVLVLIQLDKGIPARLLSESTMGRDSVSKKDSLNIIDTESLLGDNISNNIDRLHPRMSRLAHEFIDKAREEGIEILFLETHRSFETSAELQKRKLIITGVVSPHNYGLAFDAVPAQDGKAVWDDTEAFERLGKIAAEVGLVWGGNWETFKDYTHYEYPDWRTLEE